MTSITYRAIQLGPVPAEYNKLYDKLGEDGLVAINQIPFDNGNYGETITGLRDCDETLFITEEIEILNTIIKKLGGLRTTDVVELSHQETAWIENQESRELISYPKYAFELRNI